jgi:hypothetical protein
MALTMLGSLPTERAYDIGVAVRPDPDMRPLHITGSHGTPMSAADLARLSQRRARQRASGRRR